MRSVHWRGLWNGANVFNSIRYFLLLSHDDRGNCCRRPETQPNQSNIDIEPDAYVNLIRFWWDDIQLVYSAYLSNWNGQTPSSSPTSETWRYCDEWRRVPTRRRHVQIVRNTYCFKVHLCFNQSITVQFAATKSKWGGQFNNGYAETVAWRSGRRLPLVVLECTHHTDWLIRHDRRRRKRQTADQGGQRMAAVINNEFNM